MNLLGLFEKKRVVIVTIGNDMYPASPKAVKFARKEFEKILSKNDSLIIWNHTLNIKVMEEQ